MGGALMTAKNKYHRQATHSRLRILTLQNIRSARRNWAVSATQIATLKTLTQEMQLSVSAGDLILLDGRWYVTHAGLMRLAHQHRCIGINVRPVPEFCEPTSSHWVFEATAYKFGMAKGFVGYGDADPANVSPLVRGAEMRVAETRAVNRALRKAYGIGLCSVEELGSFSTPSKPVAVTPGSNGRAGSNGSSSGQPRLRDQLCLLIRQYSLDANLVKAYAADFCGTETLKEASRGLVESFIVQLAGFAKKDRDGLICKLNSYAQPVEATP
jgi:hypothetical protein